MCSLQVCGAPDNTSGVCTDSQCGGKGCRGTVGLSVTALNDVQNVTDRLTAANEDLQGVTRKVPLTPTKSREVLFIWLESESVSRAQLRNIASLTLDVKNQVKHTLEKAQEQKQHFEIGNWQLKTFIQRIRDFLMGTWMHTECDWPLAGPVADVDPSPGPLLWFHCFV